MSCGRNVIFAFDCLDLDFFSKSSFSYCEQLSQITPAYSNNGPLSFGPRVKVLIIIHTHTKAMYIVSKDFLSSLYFNFPRMFILQHVVSFT